jgi:hypothetical protein
MANVRIRDQGKLTLKDSDNSNSVSLQVPSTVSSSQDFILPNADGINNNVLKTDGSGNLSFIDINTVSVPNINWQVADVKTSDFAEGAGLGIFVNTTSGAVTGTLPASPSVGDFIAFKDYAGTFATNNFTIARNGNNIQGSANDSIISTNRASVVLQYIDATKGWLYLIENNIGDLEGPTYIAASGGTETTSGDYKIHTFTSTGTFTVSSVGNSKGGGDGVSYVTIAGGGGGAGDGSGGGGAGGYREGKNSGDPYTASPLNAPSGLTVTAQAYPVTVGAGGPAPYSNQGASGANSVFSTITSAGGGGAGHPPGPSTPEKSGAAGGSGGGAGASHSGGAGNTPPVSPPQGNAGVAGASYPSCRGQSGGGGGAGGAAPAVSNTLDGSSAIGGVGTTTNITGSPVGRAGGGGGRLGASFEPIPGRPNNGNGGGPFGGGIGGTSSVPAPAGGSGSIPGTAGTANTGGGGGGGAGNQGGQSGGSGIVIIRYKYQN